MEATNKLSGEEKIYRDAYEKIIRARVSQQIIETMVFPSNSMSEKLAEAGIAGDGVIYETLLEHWVQLKYMLAEHIKRLEIED